jgi:hypothetical protein
MQPEHLRREFKSSLSRVRDGFIIAFIGMLFAAPQIYYQSPWVYQKLKPKLDSSLQLDQFFIGNLLIMLSALLIIVLVGDLANRRAGLKPFAWPGHKKLWPALGLGILFVPVSYFLYDHFLIGLVPEMFPKRLVYALLFPFSISFPDELFARFGFLALAAWVLKKVRGGPWLGNLFVAVIFSIFNYYDIVRFIESPLERPEIVLLLLGAFVENLIAGALYLRRGLWASVAFQFGAGWKYLLYFLLFR